MWCGRLRQGRRREIHDCRELSLAWAAQGAKVGLLDADIYGPSQPLMMGLSGAKPVSPDGKHMTPLRRMA